MWRGGLIERCGDAPAGSCNGLGVRWKDGRRNRKLDRGRLDGVVVQPDHSSFRVPYFGAVVIVRLEVSVSDGVRMVTIGFVNVLRRDNGQEHHARREHASNRRAPEWVPHLGRL